MKTSTKNIVVSTLFTVFLAIVTLAFSFMPTVTARAESVTVQGAGDTFVMTEEFKAKDEQFAFSATVNFTSGQAGALVFGKTDAGCWVFNVDRTANLVKLMYFDANNAAHVLEEEFYVGSKIMNEGERRHAQSRTSKLDKVYLKVIVLPQEDGSVQVQCYADGIQRFVFENGSEEAKVLNLNEYTYEVVESEETVQLTYEGGLLGYNCFNADVTFTDQIIAKNDYSNYAELYRNQYHLSQFAHWNNDPNGMVYYNGYYHVYFQHNPYGNTWDTMHWGHARSKDLVHWEMLPIALVPDYDLPEGDNKLLGAMWSGSAMVYHKGDSATIDSYGWFNAEGKADGDVLGLIGYYSWFGDGGNRYQVLIYSDDGGLSWHKRNNIPCTTSLDLNGNPVQGGSWRDPKVFDISTLENVGDYKWGMALTDMEDNMFFFLKSKDLVHWEHAGCYEAYRPECPDVVFINDGQKTRTVITFTSRYYVVCDLSFENGNIVMNDSEGNKIDTLMNSEHFKKMDYGVDSYASQTFYIDSKSDSKYAGKNVSLSWFSGVPNAPESIESGALAAARKVWNGGGFTIPVIFGLEGETLTTTPITVEDADFAKIKTPKLSLSNKPVQGNLLKDVKGHQLEMIVKLNNPDQKPVSIKVNMSADGKYYTEIGWNQTDGYFVDRTHTEDAGLSFNHFAHQGVHNNYAKKYISGKGLENTQLDFYILVDNNNVEVYCDGYTVPFYILTFASPYSVNTQLAAEGVIVEQLTVNEFSTVWRGDYEEKMINISQTSLDLDLVLSDSKEVFAAADGELTWEIAEGQDIVQITPNETGAIVKALQAGSATIKVSSGGIERTIEVTVHEAKEMDGFTTNKAGIISGDWHYTEDGLIGSQMGGDGYLISEEQGSDFVYVAQFDLGSGAAAAIVFRATVEDGRLTNYLMANYDKPGNVVKLWSPNGELAKVSVTPQNTSNMVLSVYAQGRNVKVFLDGNQVIDVEIRENDPLSGRFGLNVCATTAKFTLVKSTSLSAEYDDGMTIGLGVEQHVYSLINVTLGNVAVNPLYYSVVGETLKVDRNYFATLPSTGSYEFMINGNKISFAIVVEVDTLPQLQFKDVTITKGNNLVVFVGNLDVQGVTVDGAELEKDEFKVENNLLTISASVFKAGTSVIALSNGSQFSVTVEEVAQDVITIDGNAGCSGMVTGGSFGCVAMLFGAALVLTSKKRKSNTIE
ncbi:MAG: GH32 C-terminal domain-containing protein [Clostridia bacterium]|nr:GH32 C-terminal domain-containing protein [Clostridia bacterium]